VPGIDNRFAREEIYWRAQREDQWDGGSYPGAKPFYEGTSVVAGGEVCRELDLITEYRWANTIDDLVLAVGCHGPAVIGIEWRDSMYEPGHRTGRCNTPDGTRDVSGAAS
jgi:hypothetical protein